MTDKERAEAFREAAKVLAQRGKLSSSAVLLHRANEFDPLPEVDTTLRGWVILTNDAGHETVFWAREDGLYGARGYSLVEWPWDKLTDTTWTVRALTSEDIGFKVRRWDAWTQKEQNVFLTADTDWAHTRANLAIDIATRQEDR